MRKKERRPGTGYRIGYGKPPKRTQFERGRSGNPRGRPKGARNKLSHRLAMDELNADHEVQTDVGSSETEGSKDDFGAGCWGGVGANG